MDPITQGALGAAVPQAFAVTRNGPVVVAGCFGFLAGLAADLDILIHSAEDPLLFLEFHRQFTHALIFIPVGGLVTATLLYLLTGWCLKLPFWRTLLFCTLGYGTHGLLDFATSYGTMLLWPFSEERFAASIISIIDPLFTVPVVALVAVAGIKRSSLYARLALVWICLYLTLATVQRNAALELAENMLTARGHTSERLTVKPTFGNILVWRSVYEAAGRFHVDGLRVGIAPRVYPGPTVLRLNPDRDFPWLNPKSQQRRDIDRFVQFSQGYASKSLDDPNAIIDVRYAFLPHTLGALWSIVLSPNVGLDQHVQFQTNRRDASAQLLVLWQLLTAE